MHVKHNKGSYFSAFLVNQGCLIVFDTTGKIN